MVYARKTRDDHRSQPYYERYDDASIIYTHTSKSK